MKTVKSVAFGAVCRTSEGAPRSPSDQSPIGRKLAPGHHGRLSMNAIPHNSIREPQNVARLSRTFSQSLSAVDLAEPLRSLDETQPAEAARELLQTRDLAVLGVRRGGAIAGWVAAGDLTGGALGEC